MELIFEQYDALQNVRDSLGRGGIPKDLKCDICGDSFSTILFKLKTFSDRDKRHDMKIGGICLCLQCLREIALLYQSHEVSWTSREREVVEALKHI